MARRVMTVSELGASAGLDGDETLLQLWDAGLNRYKEPRDRLRRQDVDIALRAVGLPTGSDLTKPKYWMDRLNLDSSSFRNLLVQLGTPMTSGASTLPKGAVARLKREITRDVDPRSQAARQRQRDRAAERLVDEPFEWRLIGHVRHVRLLSESEVEGIHEELVRDFAQDADPIDPPGVRSKDLLSSAVFRQHTSLGDASKYPTVEMAAAALFFAIVHDHPFHNGNKRTALVSMLVLLDENGVMATCDEDAVFQLVLRLAQHRLVTPGRDLPDREVMHVAEWLHMNSRNVEKGDRPIQWRKLRQILRGFDCELQHAAGVGNRLNIRRTVPERGLFGRTRQREVTTQVKFADDGRQATVDTVKRIRRDLRLDEEHGTDSLEFYQRGGPSPTGFITDYRKTLRRLAGL